MGVIQIGVNGGSHECSMTLDLDAALPVENMILNAIAGGRYYEPDVSQIFLRVLRPGDSVIDIGGNCGFFTILAGALVGPTGRVLSLEPDPANCARLRRNCELNQFTNVTVIDRPALDEARQVEFYINSDNSAGSALWNPGQFPGNVRSAEAPNMMSLQGTTIDAEIERSGISDVKLIKVDTEGAEHTVLKGAARLLGSGRVPFVLCELHPFGLEKMGSSQLGLRRYMEGFGYDCFALFYDGRLPHFLPRGTNLQTRYLCNLLFAAPQALGPYWADHLHEP